MCSKLKKIVAQDLDIDLLTVKIRLICVIMYSTRISSRRDKDNLPFYIELYNHIPREDLGVLSRECVLRIPSVS